MASTAPVDSADSTELAAAPGGAVQPADTAAAAQLSKAQLKKQRKKAAAAAAAATAPAPAASPAAAAAAAPAPAAIPTAASTTATASPTAATGSGFETDLAWCVYQIELGMQRKDASKDQIAEAKRVLAKLQDAKSPLVKRRQLMHVTFGDYRSLRANDAGWQQHLQRQADAAAAAAAAAAATATTAAPASDSSASTKDSASSGTS